MSLPSYTILHIRTHAWKKQTMLCELLARGWDEVSGNPLRESLQMDIDYASRAFLSMYSVPLKGDAFRINSDGVIQWLGNTTCGHIPSQVPQVFMDKCMAARGKPAHRRVTRPVVVHMNGLDEKHLLQTVAAKVAWSVPPVGFQMSVVRVCVFLCLCRYLYTYTYLHTRTNKIRRVRKILWKTLLSYMCTHIPPTHRTHRTHRASMLYVHLPWCNFSQKIRSMICWTHGC